MNYNIQKLNAISSAIYSQLTDHYRVDTNVENPDAILVRSASMHDMEIPASVQCIARAGAGTNNIPIDACSEKGICVFNTPGANANAVCEMVIAAMLLSCRNIIGGIEWEKTQKGLGDALEKTVEKGKSQFVGPELRGKTLGVIGLGAIGVLVSNAAVALGMNVIGYDPMISVDHAWKLSRSVRRENSLDALFSESDFLTIHVPLNDKTKGMIGTRALSLCKKGVRIMNFARGGLVDEAALINALGDERVACYVTDFGSDTLLSTEGVICIPHLGASTPESEENCAVMAAAQTRDYLESGIIRNSVNLPNVDLAPISKPRLVCIHSNIPNVLSSITSAVSAFGLNISDLVNRSRGNMAVSVLDLDTLPDNAGDSIIEKISSIEGMKRVRLLTA
ncbi:MAG: 3-phosphoglycerate dehydrogenase [Clostridia bacterium]|nr:3-phosphoglycerate dehydrogenase [Clostridia bacterium]